MSVSFVTIAVSDENVNMLEKISNVKKIHFNKVCSLAIKNFIESEKEKSEEYSILSVQE